ncbi:MOSC N-terminal beta barrel domain-containing protein [Streptomyces sp. NPDC003717]|uniref:MOSC domain-containing protein n=1 Tax=Streptomyces sp. NPDC003717 TaxID=3154276 RepID=UPI0033A46F42
MGNTRLLSIHVHPVKALTGLAPGEAVVEPWGLAGDRRWMLVDAWGKVVTQRQQPRLTLAAAELVPGGGVRLSAPGLEPLTVAPPRPAGSGPAATVPVQIFRDKLEAVPAEDPAAHAWCSAHVGADVRLVYLDEPATRRAVDPEFALPGETVTFADGYPLLLTSTASLEALNSLIAHGPHAAEGPLPMDRFRPNLVVTGSEAWAEDGWTRLAVGEAVFRVAKPCGRCVVTTTDQVTATRGKEPLYSLGRHRLIEGRLVFGQNLVPVAAGTVRVGDPVRVLE